MPKFIQPSFAGGEIAPELHGRFDIRKYHTGLAKAKNAIVHKFGGVSNRAGLRYLEPAASGSHTDSSPSVRLIPFVFNDQDAYVLELGDRYMRVLRNGSHVLARTITGVIASGNTDTFASRGHGLANNDEVYLSGFSQLAALNGRRFVVTGRTTDTFKIKDQQTGAAISLSRSETSGGTVGRSISATYSVLG